MIGLAERLLAGGVLLCLVFAGGYRLGVTHQKNATEAAQQREVVGTIERHDAAAEAGHVVEQKTLRAVRREADHTRQLIQETRAYVKAPSVGGTDQFRLDPDLLYRWRAANRGASADPVSLADRSAAGRDPAAAGEPDGRTAGGEPHRGRGDVPHAADPLSRPGAVDRGDGPEAPGADQ